LCPCSKEISDYGAHNQRGYVEIEAVSPWSAGEASGIWLDDLIAVAEAAGSAPIYSLLKRSDEREVTMRAYDNPAFVEDIVRDVVVALRADVRVAEARVKATNQESIHDHSAVAEVRWSRSDG
jgi:MptA/FolE2 family GTP cyclohydrolase